MTGKPVPSVDEMLKKLEPEHVRANLVRAGLYLAGWEMLKSEIQNKVKEFYLTGFDENGLTYSIDFDRRVLARHKSRFEASLLWLVEANGLTEAEADQARALREYRNEVAHELPKMLTEVGHDIDVDRIRQMNHLLKSLGVFWGRIEVDINPDFDGQDVDDEGIQSGIMLLMEHLLAAAEEMATPAAVSSRDGVG